MASNTLKDDFLKYLCQTSPDPMGIEVERAEGCTITDRSGRTYLDFISGIGVANIGHAHPMVVKAISEQAGRYLHVMVYGEFIQEAQVHLAKKLSGLLPEQLSVTYFTNSGTEANEGAIKTAKKFTGRKKLTAFKGSFHGDSQGSLSVTGREVYQKPFLPLLPLVSFLPFNDRSSLSQIDEETAAVIIEPIQGEGGVHVPDPDFLPAVRARCSQTGTVLIFDEVLTGMGRTGKMFAFEHWGAVPDILVLAKSLGGGMPLGAFISRPEIMLTLSTDPPLSHVTTFGGHPVCCSAALASIDVLSGQDLPGRAERLGVNLMERIREFGKDSGVKEVRGKGLLIGMEMEDSKLTERFALNCRKAGLILGWTLHSNTVIRLAPPLVISEEEMDRGLGIMEKALRA